MSEMLSGGPSTDAANNPVIDPTKNVYALVDAANRRQDDLREMQASYTEKVANIREGHQKELRQAESARIDSIRQVDQTTIQQAAEVQATQATALAAQVAASAEAMRNQVAAAASAASIALASALAPITSAIEQLRQSMYEAQGQKTQVVETQNRGMSIGMWIGVALTAAVVMVGVLGIVATIVIAIATHGFTK